MAETKKIELSGGNWAEIRTSNKFKDLRALRQAQTETDDQVFIGVALMKEKIVRWSFGEVNDDTIDELEMDDVQAILSVLNEGAPSVPNPSSPSSDGSPKVKASRRRSGGQE